MATYTPFLCRVTPHGTPFFVPIEPSSDVFVIDNLSAEEVCRYYWLLNAVTIDYRMTFNGSLEVLGDLLLGGMYAAAPRMRLLSVPDFSNEIFDSSSGVQSEGIVDFSKIYLQNSGSYALVFDFIIYARVETVGGSNFLVSFHRSPGSSGQRDSYKTYTTDCFGKNITIYLNYNSQIWATDEIELNECSMVATFYENNV
ncbi:MAG: hypothetical protein LBI77_00585 [Puniceicoccales bacterium]|jgi:hypothetical protein|nr:hypothetical protein [Puniceicoccales bacterium]